MAGKIAGRQLGDIEWSSCSLFLLCAGSPLSAPLFAAFLRLCLLFARTLRCTLTATSHRDTVLVRTSLQSLVYSFASVTCRGRGRAVSVVAAAIGAHSRAPRSACLRLPLLSGLRIASPPLRLFCTIACAARAARIASRCTAPACFLLCLALTTTASSLRRRYASPRTQQRAPRALQHRLITAYLYALLLRLLARRTPLRWPHHSCALRLALPAHHRGTLRIAFSFTRARAYRRFWRNGSKTRRRAAARSSITRACFAAAAARAARRAAGGNKLKKYRRKDKRRMKKCGVACVAGGSIVALAV